MSGLLNEKLGCKVEKLDLEITITVCREREMMQRRGGQNIYSFFPSFYYIYIIWIWERSYPFLSFVQSSYSSIYLSKAKQTAISLCSLSPIQKDCPFCHFISPTFFFLPHHNVRINVAETNPLQVFFFFFQRITQIPWSRFTACQYPVSSFINFILCILLLLYFPFFKVIIIFCL